MKFNFLQGDFSGGELSPRAQGHVDSDAYKSGLRRASNVVPTRTGSIASRAGLEALLEGVDAHAGGLSNLPVQHIDVHDGPYGDFVIEVSPTGLRFLDKSGVLPWNLPPTSELVQFTVQDGAYAYGDSADGTVYLRSDAATGVRSYYLTKGSGAQNAMLPALSYLNLPAGTTNQWILSGKIAGDSITARVVESDGDFQDFAVAPDVNGNFSVTFRPIVGGPDQDFYIQLMTAAGTTATHLWDINLTKNNVKTVQDTTVAVLSLPAGDTTPLASTLFNGAVVAPTQERVRHAAFWAREDFWVALAGGANNRYAGFALRWHNNAALVTAAAKAVSDALALLTTYSTLTVFTTDAADLATYNANASAANAAALVNDSVSVAQDVLNAAVAVSNAAGAWAGGGTDRGTADAAVRVLTDASASVTNTAAAAAPPTQWTFGTLPCTANSLLQVVGANAVAVFQDRLWYGINLPNGKRVIRASVVGYGRAWGYAPQANSTGTPKLDANDWLFQFTVETETFRTPSTTYPFFTYKFPADNAKATLLVTVNGEVRLSSADFLQAGHYNDYQAGQGTPEAGGGYSLNQNDQTKSPGGVVAFRGSSGPPYPLTPGSSPGDLVTIQRVALADDPLDLNLASPSGKVAWLNVLRGLVLGTTRNEKLFARGVALSIDPATGQSFDIEDESSYGADPALPALDINDKVLFVQQGRRVLRYAGLSITTNGGLVSEDVGVAGEHLTRERVRSFCFLKSPVPRVVMAFDDGTGAVMSILTDRRVAFSRFTIPACFGGIYSVAALNTKEDSELWVGTENGVTLWAATLESDITSKELVISAAVPTAPTHLKFDLEAPLPPVMDGWQRLPLVYVGEPYVTGLPACMVGQSVYALINGQMYGPHVVGAGGEVVLSDIDPDLNTTWIDATGTRRVQEVYVGLLFPEHRFTTLPLEGGNPVGSSQNLTSRKPQLYLRLVDSYLPLVNGVRLAERGPADATDALGARVTDDRRATEEGFQRGGVVDVVMDLPLRMEISAVHGGVVMNNI